MSEESDKYWEEQMERSYGRVMKAMKTEGKRILDLGGGDSITLNHHRAYLGALQNVAYNAFLLSLVAIKGEARHDLLRGFIRRLMDTNLETLGQTPDEEEV